MTTNHEDNLTRHAEWLDARYTDHPPVRLAAIDPSDSVENPVFVDVIFADASLALRGAFAPKRGRGRPRKTV